DFVPWAIAGGVIGGHLMHLFLYHPEELHGPLGALQILKVWDGLSSTGGVIGGALVAVLWFRAHRLNLLQYGDVLALAIAPGWAIARLGCFSVHDHPGVLTNFFLAVQFPGGARHDLGLYDALLLFALTVLLYWLSRRQLLVDGPLVIRRLPCRLVHHLEHLRTSSPEKAHEQHYRQHQEDEVQHCGVIPTERCLDDAGMPLLGNPPQELRNRATCSGRSTLRRGG